MFVPNPNLGPPCFSAPPLPRPRQGPARRPSPEKKRGCRRLLLASLGLMRHMPSTGCSRPGREPPSIRAGSCQVTRRKARLCAIQRAGTRLASRQRHDSEWTVTARGLNALPIGLGREGRGLRGEPTVRVTKLRGGLPWLPAAMQPGHCGRQLARSFKGAGLYTCRSVRIGTSQAPGEAGILVLESNMAQQALAPRNQLGDGRRSHHHDRYRRDARRAARTPPRRAVQAPALHRPQGSMIALAFRNTAISYDGLRRF